MKARTLVTQRLYFGMNALDLRTASARVLSRVVGLPPERARVSARSLRQDFGVDTVRGNALVEQFIAEGLVERPTALQADYALTECHARRRVLDKASRRVTAPPLARRAWLGLQS